MSTKVLKAFNAKETLQSLAKVGDFFGVGEQLADQVEDVMDDFAHRGQEWAKACQEDWSGLKNPVPWLTGNLSESIQWEDGIQEKGKPYFWVGVDLNMLLGPKIRTVTNYIDYYYRLGDPVEVQSEDYTEAVNEENTTGVTHFIENVWWVTAGRNLKEVMR